MTNPIEDLKALAEAQTTYLSAISGHGGYHIGEYEAELDHIVANTDFPKLAAHMEALEAENARLQQVLNASPIFSKYHTANGFEYDAFQRDYGQWVKAKQEALKDGQDD